jgi:hypothetical protein
VTECMWNVCDVNIKTCLVSLFGRKCMFYSYEFCLCLGLVIDSKSFCNAVKITSVIISLMNNLYA